MLAVGAAVAALATAAVAPAVAQFDIVDVAAGTRRAQTAGRTGLASPQFLHAPRDLGKPVYARWLNDIGDHFKL